MSSAKITLFGMYDWLKTENVDMFESFKFLPSDIDMDTLTGVILTEGGEFEPLYANPYMMKDQVQIFVTSHLRTFTKWIDALNIKYNPLENYDRMEEWDDTSNGTSSHTSNQRRDSTHNSHTEGTSNDSSSGTQSAESSGSTTGSGSDSTDSTTTNEVSAYDATGYSPHDKSTVDTDVTSSTSSTTESSGETTTSSTSSGNTSGNDYGTETESITDGTQGNTTGSNHRVGRAHGNIGVTTSQQMLESEIEVARFNIYQQIADLFIDELLLAVYI